MDMNLTEKAVWQGGRLESPRMLPISRGLSRTSGVTDGGIEHTVSEGGPTAHYNIKKHTPGWRFKCFRHGTYEVACRTTCLRTCWRSPALSKDSYGLPMLTQALSFAQQCD